MEHEKGRSKAAATGKRRSKAIFLIHDMNRQSEAKTKHSAFELLRLLQTAGKGEEK